MGKRTSKELNKKNKSEELKMSFESFSPQNIHGITQRITEHFLIDR
jgi:hypothetical protein